MLLSLFCGAGGLDLGFEEAGYDVRLAFDVRKDSIASYNHNRPAYGHGMVQDVSKLPLPTLDRLAGGRFAPEGVIGGPPCQSFSRANSGSVDTDPRHTLPLAYASLLRRLNEREPLKFFVMENVTGLMSDRHKHRLRQMESEFKKAGFTVSSAVLLGTDYGTPQKRERLFLVGINTQLYGGVQWTPPQKLTTDPAKLTVKATIGHLPDATLFEKNLTPDDIAFHVNHWCMQPRSSRFTTQGALTPGDGRNRSFKTLAWNKPSLTVAYGHREVHIHPNCHRRLSVYEAMLLQGFPKDYELIGSLSSQIVQVSEAVPPPMARAVAESVRDLIASLDAVQVAKTGALALSKVA
jgi:DNA (cytosine-5)-methyltransferase 1